MNIICGYRNVREWAKEVTEYGNKVTERQRFSPYPWNRFDPAATEWWCVPSSEYPCYRFGKGFFWRLDLPKSEGGGCPYCGLYVEKGLDRIVAQAYPAVRQKGFVLDETWKAWPKLLDGLDDGSLAEAAAAVAGGSGQPVILCVATWYASDPNDFEPHPEIGPDAELECRLPTDGGRAWFIVAKDGKLERLGRPRCIRKAMEPVASSRSLPELARALRPNGELNWCWVDFNIGVQCLLFDPTSVSISSSYWGADKIWHVLIRPWLPWII